MPFRPSVESSPTVEGVPALGGVVSSSSRNGSTVELTLGYLPTPTASGYTALTRQLLSDLNSPSRPIRACARPLSDDRLSFANFASSPLLLPFGLLRHDLPPSPPSLPSTSGRSHRPRLSLPLRDPPRLLPLSLRRRARADPDRLGQTDPRSVPNLVWEPRRCRT